MSAQENATFAAIAAMARQLSIARLVGVFGLAFGLSGCLPATAPLVGADPTDPAAAIVGVGYRSTTAPYARVRPSEPAPWVQQNQRVAPAPRSDR
jgi:hypothetical protein